MRYDEAVRRGFDQCRSRGYRCELQDARLTGNNVWKVRMRVDGRGEKGHLFLDYDAFSRDLISVNDKVRDDWYGPGRGRKGHAHRDD